jgi:hypothetical protein
MSPVVFRFVFQAQRDGLMDHIWDSSPMVSLSEYEELKAKYETTVNILQQTESRLAQLQRK